MHTTYGSKFPLAPRIFPETGYSTVLAGEAYNALPDLLPTLGERAWIREKRGNGRARGEEKSVGSGGGAPIGEGRGRRVSLVNDMGNVEIDKGTAPLRIS